MADMRVAVFTESAFQCEMRLVVVLVLVKGVRFCNVSPKITERTSKSQTRSDRDIKLTFNDTVLHVVLRRSLRRQFSVHASDSVARLAILCCAPAVRFSERATKRPLPPSSPLLPAHTSSTERASFHHRHSCANVG